MDGFARKIACRRVGPLWALALILTGLATAGAPAPSAAAEQLRVFVAIPPQVYLVQRLAPQAQVRALLPPGANPHTFEPTPRQLLNLGRADLYLGLDLPFEERLLPELAELSPGMRLADMSEGIVRRRLAAHHDHGEEHGREPAKKHERAGHGHEQAEKPAEHEHESGEPDPHVWLSPRLAKVMAANAAKALSAVDPAHKDDYQANLAALDRDLDALDRRLAKILAPLRGREFLVYHPAFGYLADAYGLKQEPVELEGKSPGPRALAQVIDRAREEHIRVIFVQPQFSEASARRVAEAIGGAVVPLDPLAPDYMANLERMARALEDGLAKGKP